ncbi:MAG: PAAR domain-containing protein [Paucimonas sp.]|jgi:uncharacterized Zn-binding protein involved in type VI secretion|nr:PAAR domain-containing protein [Paucimonas sp.]
MAKGYFIAQGDKTTCGGKVIEGDPHINLFGIMHAREGHAVTCGVTGQTYQIVGGIDQFISNGRRAAGTGNSLSSCPCRAQLIPSIFHMTYDYETASAPSPTAFGTASQPGNGSQHAFTTTPTHAANVSVDEPDIERCSGCFHLVDQWGAPCATHQYALLRNASHLAGDVLNQEGYSHICYSANATRLNIATSAPAPMLE